MQPYRIDEMAKAIAAETTPSWGWDELSEANRESFRDKARQYAAALLGGEPTVEVQHGVREANGKVHGPYQVAQAPALGWVNVQREKVVYAAAAFVTAWAEAPLPYRPSTAASARYTVDCPTCGARGASARGAGDGEACRAKSGRVTDTHEARIDAQYPSR